MEYVGSSLSDEGLIHIFKIFDPIYINIVENEDNKEAIHNLINLCEKGKVEVEVNKPVKKTGRPINDEIYKRFEIWLMNRGLSVFSSKRYSYNIKKLEKGNVKTINPDMRTAIKHWHIFLSELNNEKKSKSLQEQMI